MSKGYQVLEKNHDHETYLEIQFYTVTFECDENISVQLKHICLY